MAYTRKYIEKIRHTTKSKPVLDDLLSRFHKGEELALAEEEYACSILNILRDQSGNYAFDITKLEGCKNYRFRDTYILYAYDLNGLGNIRNFFGSISAARKQDDVKFLDEQFKSWDLVIKGKKTGDVLLGYLMDETIHQVKMMDKYCQNNNFSEERRNYLYKSIILHSRYIFLLVKGFYQDFGNKDIVIELYGNKVLIDQFCFIHTMFRHFAAGVKDYQRDKSYHFDQSVFYQDLPLFLMKFVEIFRRNCPKAEFNNKSIDLIFRRKKYSLWFRPFTIHKAGTATTYLRLQTFYPIEAARDLFRVQSLRKVKINRRLTLLVRHLYS